MATTQTNIQSANKTKMNTKNTSHTRYSHTEFHIQLCGVCTQNRPGACCEQHTQARLFPSLPRPPLYIVLCGAISPPPPLRRIVAVVGPPAEPEPAMKSAMMSVRTEFEMNRRCYKMEWKFSLTKYPKNRSAAEHRAERKFSPHFLSSWCFFFHWLALIIVKHKYEAPIHFIIFTLHLPYW